MYDRPYKVWGFALLLALPFWCLAFYFIFW